MVVVQQCDVCGESVKLQVNDVQLRDGVLSANWGDASSVGGNVYHLDLCHDCFKYALSALREKRRSLAMFNEEIDLPDEDFGRIDRPAPNNK